MDLDAHLLELLGRAETSGLLRTSTVIEGGPCHVVVDGRELVSFASNDYLGLAEDPSLRAELARAAQAMTGAGSSRAVAGTTPVHRAAERCLAEHVRLPSVRIFSSAYAANLGVLGSLFSDSDVILSDSLNHASLIDGCRLCRARIAVYRHGDLDHLASLLHELAPQARVAAVVTESIFSMDGDVADIGALRELTSRHRAALIVDEAHSIGIVGGAGEGACAAAGVSPDVLIGGLGKAFGLAGGFVAGSEILTRALDNFARTLVFSTASLPAIAAAVPHATSLVRQATDGRARVQSHALRIRNEASRHGTAALGRAPAAIVPIVIGEPADALAAAAAFRARGYLIPVMRPPTVPVGTSRLRWTATALHSDAEVRGACAALADVLPLRLPAKPQQYS